ncbi:murein L,D-transpeptidase [Dongia sp.]|uniref:L,D-transpeptidase family protein n=1 Tax=Dongia sp. TaxID=1977262 RepID=UPI0035B0F96E
MKASLRRLRTFIIALAALASSTACSVPSPAPDLPKEETPAAISAETAQPPVATTGASSSSFTDATLSPLNEALAAYRQAAAAGGWPHMTAPSKLEVGATGTVVHSLRVRLAASGDLTGPSDGDRFDTQLADALRRFQQRHGLLDDAILGPKTLAALNVPIEDRIRTLQTNLARLQAERRQWGQRYIVVNTAAAMYRLVEAGETVFERRVIVGRPNWPTPRLEGLIDEIVFHPTWTVPPRIARLELLPRIRREPGYLAAHNMHVVEGLIRQAAGPDNPLGKVKFVFPNDESIYLHDTNAPSLFAKADRFLSHGCIRLSNAEELVRHLLRQEPGWNDALISEKLEMMATESVLLTHSIPVHIVYDTAWVDEDGTVNFRDDTYRRDLGR